MLLSQCGLLFQLLLWHNRQPQNLVVKQPLFYYAQGFCGPGIQNEHSEDGFSRSTVTGSSSLSVTWQLGVEASPTHMSGSSCCLSASTSFRTPVNGISLWLTGLPYSMLTEFQEWVSQRDAVSPFII